MRAPSPARGEGLRPPWQPEDIAQRLNQNGARELRGFSTILRASPLR